MKKQFLGILTLLVIATLASSLRVGDVQAQERVSVTPVNVSLPTATPFSTEQFAATPTTTRTPTAIGPALLEPKATAGDVNVRLLPDPEADRLGSISPGERFPVSGQYFQWYQIQYELSPNGRAWVFGQLVDIIGDASAIPAVDPFAEPTVDSGILDVTQTWEAITLTPGGLLTATANARVLPAPTSDGSSGIGTANPDFAENTAEVNAVAPTFTYPADIVAVAPTQRNPDAEFGQPITGVTTTTSNEIPPLLPVIILGGLGLLGLFVSSLRR